MSLLVPPAFSRLVHADWPTIGPLQLGDRLGDGLEKLFGRAVRLWHVARDFVVHAEHHRIAGAFDRHFRGLQQFAAGRLHRILAQLPAIGARQAPPALLLRHVVHLRARLAIAFPGGALLAHVGLVPAWHHEARLRRPVPQAFAVRQDHRQPTVHALETYLAVPGRPPWIAHGFQTSVLQAAPKADDVWMQLAPGAHERHYFRIGKSVAAIELAPGSDRALVAESQLAGLAHPLAVLFILRRTARVALGQDFPLERPGRERAIWIAAIAKQLYLPLLASQAGVHHSLNRGEVARHDALAFRCRDPVPRRFSYGVHGIAIDRIEPSWVAVSNIAHKLFGVHAFVRAHEVQRLKPATGVAPGRRAVVARLKAGAAILAALVQHGIQFLRAGFGVLKTHLQHATQFSLRRRIRAF